MMEGWKVGKWKGSGALAIAAIALSNFPTFQRSALAQDTVPPGLGTLKRDGIVVRFTTATVEIQFLPLDEQVIRLLAPDTYRSLVQLIQSRQSDITAAAERAGEDHPTLVLVTFFGLVPQARFNPEDVNVTNRGRLFRPIGIVPLSPTWGSYQLEARQQAVAIYLFEEGISFRETLTVSYQGQVNDSWSRALRVLDQERARVRARGSSTRPSRSGVQRTPAESVHTTLTRHAARRGAVASALSQPSGKNAVAQASAATPLGASTVTDRGGARSATVLTDPPRISTAASVLSELSGSAIPTIRRVGRAETQKN